MDMIRVAAWCGSEVELACHVAVYDSRNEWDRISILTEQGDPKKHMVEAVVVAVVLDANPFVLQQMLGDGHCLLAW